MSIQHHATQHTFTSGQAELAYELPDAHSINFVHTFVPENERGQGLGDELARAGLAYARQQHLRVQADCPFIAAYIERHPEEVSGQVSK